MFISKTTLDDLEAVDCIYNQAKLYMRTHGNASQWSGEYPSYKDAAQDITDGVGYVCVDNSEIVAVFMFKIGEEPTYNQIFDGKWLNADQYGVIHRLAVKYHGRGIADFCLAKCFENIPNIKIDTHSDNIAMQKLLSRNGFVRCGVIYLENGEARLAYQKIN